MTDTISTRLSTCDLCGGTIKLCEGTGWWHTTGTDRGHTARPDDSYVSGPDSDGLGPDLCEECGEEECHPECECSGCDSERALDEDADAYYGREA